MVLARVLLLMFSHGDSVHFDLACEGKVVFLAATESNPPGSRVMSMPMMLAIFELFGCPGPLLFAGLPIVSSRVSHHVLTILAEMILSNNSMGFCVGYPNLSFE